MLQYKVIYVNTERGYLRYDGEQIKIGGTPEEDIMQSVLNHLAQYGWRLVQTVHDREERFFLYLEKEA